MYNDTVTSFEDLLIKDRSFTNNHQNIQSLAMETNKTLNDLPGENFREFLTRASYTNNLLSKSELMLPSINTVTKGTVTVKKVHS